MSCCDVDSPLISRNERPLRWTYTEGVSIMKSKYKSCIFKKAAQVFALVMHHEDSDEAQKKKWSLYRVKEKGIPDFDSLEEKRQVLELVFGTLLYDEIYRTVLDNRSFFYEYPELQKLAHLTIVVLHDMQSRKLLPGICDCEPYPDSNVRDVENALLNFRLKIGAEIAKIRIENHAATFHQLRPSEFQRFPDPCVSKTTLWGWVNRKKKNIPTVVNLLKDSGLRVDEVKSISDLSLELSDVFSVRLNDPYDLLKHPSVKQHKFVVQDVSCCIAPQCLVNTLLQQCRIALGHQYMPPHDRRVAALLYIPCPPLYPALGPWDVAVSDIGNGLAAAHLASLLHSFGFRGRVLAFGGNSAEEKLRIRNMTYGVRVPGVQVIQKSLMDFSPENDTLQRIRAVLVLPKCTRSAIIDPINFLCSEGGVASFFRELYENESNREELYQSQMNLLKFCLKLPKIQVVVYMTHSMNPKENQDIVQGAVDDINAIAEPSIATNDQVNQSSCSGDDVKCENLPKVIRINTVFEVSPIPVNAEGYILKRSRSSPYVKVQPENGRNGCFIAAITRKEIPESFNPEADGDSETDLALLFKESPLNETGKIKSRTRRAVEPQHSQDRRTGSLESIDSENEISQDSHGDSDAESVNKILFRTETLKNKGKKASKRKGKKNPQRKQTATTKKTNYSPRSSHHLTCFSETPSKERPKTGGSQTERFPGRVTHSRLSRNPAKARRKQETPLPKLETLTLNHFVAGKNQAFGPKFRTFLNEVEKSKTGPTWAEEPIKGTPKQTKSPKRTHSRRRRSRSMGFKTKSKKLPLNLSEKATSVKLKQQLSGPFTVKDITYSENTKISPGYERIYDTRESYPKMPPESESLYDSEELLDFFSDGSDEDSEDSCDEFGISSRPSRKWKSLGQRRRRYERHHKLYLNPRKKEDLDDVLSDMLGWPEEEKKSTKSISNSPSSATQWTGKLTVVNDENSNTFDSPCELKLPVGRSGNKEFDVYLPESEIPRVRESINRTGGILSGDDPCMDNDLEDISKVQQWLLKNNRFCGTRFQEGTLSLKTKPVSFRNVMTPELRLPKSHRPEFQYQKEDHVCIPQKKTPPLREQ